MVYSNLTDEEKRDLALLLDDAEIAVQSRGCATDLTEEEDWGG
jgi:hypothetical protein